MPSPIPDEKLDELSGLIFRRRKLEAIKVYRGLTGLGLKEAKDAIEALELTLQRDFPEKFAAPPQGKGCLGATALLCLLAAAGACWLIRR